MKSYKPNNSTLLYLNSSFNCIKSSSITITKVLSGTDYTSNPTILIVPAAGDMGYGAAVTITQSAGVLGTLTTVSTGKGYNILPTIRLTGGGIPGVITGFTSLVGGTGYTSIPNVTIAGGGNTGATARAILTGTSVTGIFIINGGKNYAFSGGGGSGASAAPTLN